MKTRALHLFAAAAVAAVLPAAVMPVHAQNFPSQNIRFVAPFPAGGAADLYARMIAETMSRNLGVPVVVENHPGATGQAGVIHVLKQPADGHTIFVATSSVLVGPLYLRATGLPFDPRKDVVPLTQVGESATSIAISGVLPFKTLKDMIDYAKKNPGKLSYSTSGVGSGFHLNGESFNHAAGVQILHVPYKGAAQAMNDLIAGRISMTFSAVQTPLPYLKDGSVRLLAVLEDRRFPTLPDVPTVKETVPAFERPSGWVGIFGAAGIPAPLVARLNKELVAAIKTPDNVKKFLATAFQAIGNSPEEFRTVYLATFGEFERAVKIAGIKPD